MYQFGCSWSNFEMTFVLIFQHHRKLADAVPDFSRIHCGKSQLQSLLCHASTTVAAQRSHFHISRCYNRCHRRCINAITQPSTVQPSDLSCSNALTIVPRDWRYCLARSRVPGSRALGRRRPSRISGAQSRIEPAMGEHFRIPRRQHQLKGSGTFCHGKWYRKNMENGSWRSVNFYLYCCIIRKFRRKKI